MSRLALRLAEDLYVCKQMHSLRKPVHVCTYQARTDLHESHATEDLNTRLETGRFKDTLLLQEILELAGRESAFVKVWFAAILYNGVFCISGDRLFGRLVILGLTQN